MSYEQQFIQLGLSREQAAVYSTLLKNGSMRAKKISQIAKLNRVITYKVLDKLVEKNLVEKIDKVGEVSIFNPKHPSCLKDLVNEMDKSVKQASLSLDTVIGQMISQYNSLSGKPNVFYYEGVEGLSEVYKDILDTGEEISLIRSYYDNTKPEYHKVVLKQIEDQVRYGIKSRVLAPLVPGSIKRIMFEDKKNLVERCIIFDKKFILPAQIMIYGEKVAITSFDKDNLYTTIIDNVSINKTFRIIFNFIWNTSKKESDKYIDNLKKKINNDEDMEN